MTPEKLNMKPEEMKEIDSLIDFLKTPNTVSNLYESVIVRRELFLKMVETLKFHDENCSDTDW